MKLLGVNDVCRIIGKCRTTLYRWELSGNFPKSIPIGPNSIAWLESDVFQWIEAKKLGGVNER